MGGGNREPKVEIVGGAFRGRYKEDGLTQQQLEVRNDGKTNTLTTVQKDNVVVNHEQMYWRALTPLECERLQTVPDGYTQYGDMGGEQFDKDGNFIRYTTKPISKSQRYKMLGNGFTVDVISTILKGVSNEK